MLSLLTKTDTISMEQLGSSSRDGISGFQSLRKGRVFALCILWRILHFGTDCHHWNWLYMDLDSLVSEPRFLVLMISIFANIQKSLTTSGEVISSSLMLFHEFLLLLVYIISLYLDFFYFILVLMLFSLI